MPTRSLSFEDDVAALIDAAPNRSRAVADAVRWAHRLDLTDERVTTLAELAQRLGTLGVGDPFDAAATIAERAVADAFEALQSLVAGGWRGREVLAVMQAMMGTLWLRGSSLGHQLALEMHEGAALDAVDLGGWGVATERWAALVSRVAENPEDARSLLDIARVFWATQGSRLEQMLRRDLQRQPDPDADPGA